MAGTKKVKVTMELEVTDPGAIKVIEHHADRLLDLDSWPEIISVSDVSVSKTKSGMTRERAVRIASDYINNDAEAADHDYIRDTLDQIGVSLDEAEELGLGWLYPEEG